jgi:hypothetical protein
VVAQIPRVDAVGTVPNRTGNGAHLHYFGWNEGITSVARREESEIRTNRSSSHTIE